VESYPRGTTLDHPDIPDASWVWPEMIRSARHTLDFAEFYASNAPGSALEPVLRAMEDAARRGVRVRFLAEKKFSRIYPETLGRLRRHGIQVRLFDASATTGGVLHAKYFIVDGREAFLGSQNFDWRALEHIQELGVRVRVPEVVRALARVFERDWESAGFRSPARAPRAGRVRWARVVDGGDTTEVALVASPLRQLPEGVAWDLPELLRMLEGARRRVRVQLLTYRSQGHGTYFGSLEGALRRCAARGVRVQVLVADWCQRRGIIEGLKSLQHIPGIEVRLVTIPPWRGGFIPYARVIHAKYLVVDGREAWVGTSNWERDYFYASRNVGLLIRGGVLPARLDAFFRDLWESPYAETVDPCRRYEPPRIGE
jgi:phosphatidylserine/phosphatidylglycerophosphate/cardiolipin synthase-like enzyme